MLENWQATKNKVVTLCSYFLVFGLGLVVLPFGSSWYEIPKVITAWIIVAILSVLFFGFSQDIKASNWSRISVIFFLLFALLSTADLFFFHTSHSFFGNVFRFQGILTFWTLLTFSYLAPQTINEKKFAQYSVGLFIVIILAAVLGRVDQAGRHVSLLGEANSLGAYAVFLFPFTVKKKPALFFLFAVVLVFLSGSRSAFLGLIIESLVLLIAPKFGKTKATLMAVTLMVLSLALPFLGERQTFDDRVTIWQTAAQAGWERPILGWGIGNIEDGLKHAATPLQTTVRYQYVDSSHNIFLDWWVQGGMIGLFLFLSFYSLSLYQLVQEKEYFYIASLLGTTTVLLFNPVSIAILIPFWWILGVGIRTSEAGIIKKIFRESKNAKKNK